MTIRKAVKGNIRGFHLTISIFERTIARIRRVNKKKEGNKE
jgi:hypothetical protein